MMMLMTSNIHWVFHQELSQIVPAREKEKVVRTAISKVLIRQSNSEFDMHD